MTKYYYIDDDPNSQNKVQGFENNELSIVAMQHKDSWEEQLKFLKEIAESIIINGYQDKEYTTQGKYIPGYVYAETKVTDENKKTTNVL